MLRSPHRRHFSLFDPKAIIQSPSKYREETPTPTVYRTNFSMSLPHQTHRLDDETENPGIITCNCPYEAPMKTFGTNKSYYSARMEEKAYRRPGENRGHDNIMPAYNLDTVDTTSGIGNVTVTDPAHNGILHPFLKRLDDLESRLSTVSQARFPQDFLSLAASSLSLQETQRTRLSESGKPVDVTSDSNPVARCDAFSDSQFPSSASDGGSDMRSGISDESNATTQDERYSSDRVRRAGNSRSEEDLRLLAMQQNKMLIIGKELQGEIKTMLRYLYGENKYINRTDYICLAAQVSFLFSLRSCFKLTLSLPHRVRHWPHTFREVFPIFYNRIRLLAELLPISYAPSMAPYKLIIQLNAQDHLREIRRGCRFLSTR